MADRDRAGIDGMALRLGITRKTAYQHCRTYDLPIPKRTRSTGWVPKSRLFRRAYDESRSIRELADRIGVHPSTALRRCRRLGLNTDLSGAADERDRIPRAQRPDIFALSYRGLMTLRDVARTTRYSVATVQRYLWDYVDRRWSKPQRWPKPARLSYLKAVHELDDDPLLRDDLSKLSAVTGIKEETLRHYFETEDAST